MYTRDRKPANWKVIGRDLNMPESRPFEGHCETLAEVEKLILDFPFSEKYDWTVERLDDNWNEVRETFKVEYVPARIHITHS